MRRIFQWVIDAIHCAINNLLRFCSDREHGITEAIQLGFGLGFCGLDHQRAGDRPAHGGCMKAAIH